MCIQSHYMLFHSLLHILIAYIHINPSPCTGIPTLPTPTHPSTPLPVHSASSSNPCRRPHRVQQPPPDQVVLVEDRGVYAPVPHEAHGALVAVGAAYNRTYQAQREDKIDL